jgi:hypothetical protein
MKKIFKCEFKFTNLTSRVWVSVFFYMEGTDKYNVERQAIIKACEELKSGEVKNYELTYYRVEETEASKNATSQL